MTESSRRGLQPGAHWVRAALQVNPFDYVGNNAPSTSFLSEDDYNKALVERCLEQNIEIIAITDHWSVDTATGLAAAAAKAGIAALPGFEASSSEGKHLLVIFDEATPLAEINAAIGACGVTPGCKNGTGGDPYAELLQAMTDRGAMVIPAHANVPNSGLLTGRAGPPLVKMITDPNLHAIAITPSQPKGTDQVNVFEGRAPYERSHPLSMIYADDICHPNTLTDVGATTFFKVSRPCLESLKLAIRTPATRVWLQAPAVATRVILTSVSWEGGLLDGIELPLSDELTTLIGGRGTGKSTVIESLRFVLNVEPIGDEAKRDHKGIVSDVLGAGTTVSVTLERALPTPTRYTIQRSVGDVPVVKDVNGEVTALKPHDITGTVEIYGQHELAELAQDKDSVAQMLQRFAGHELIESDHADVLSSLRENRRKLGGLDSKLAAVQSDVDDIPRIEGQLRQYDASSLPERLKEQERLGADKIVLTAGEARLAEVREEFSDMSESQVLRTLVADIEGIDDSPNSALLAKVPSTLKTLNSAVLKALARRFHPGSVPQT